MDRPACPICGAADERPPDALGVHRCSACAIDFRPASRMPIRRAGVPPPSGPHPDRGGVVVAVVIVGVMLGLAAVVGAHKASTRPPPSFDPITPPVFDPAIYEALGNFEVAAPFTTLPLARELHLTQISDGELFATGVVYADDLFAVEQVSVEVSCRDLAGAQIANSHALVSCRTMQPGERCAWMIDTKVPGTIAEVEFNASGRRAHELHGPAQLDLRSDRPGEVEFDPDRRTVKFEIRERSATRSWATVTAYNPQQRVLGVAETRWPGDLEPGRHQLEVTVPKPPDEVARHEVRIGGDRLELEPPRPASR